MPNISDAFHDEMIEHTLDLMRYSESVREKVLGLLEQFGEDVDNKIAPGGPFTQFQQERLKGLFKWMGDTTATAYEKIGKVHHNELMELADLESNFIPRMANDVIGAQLLRNGLTRNDLQELVTKSMIQGAPQKEWWSQQKTKLQNSFMQQIRMGVIAGETNDQLVKRIRGTFTGQKKVITDSDGNKKIIPTHTGGILDVSKREATALVRTSVQTVSNNVLARTYADNADVVKGMQALATLDGRTTPLCRARDKLAWYLPGSGPKPGQIDPGATPKPKPPKPKAPEPFQPPFPKPATPGNVTAALKQLPGFAGTSFKGWGKMPKTVAAETGNTLARLEHHFGDAVGLTSVDVEDLANPQHYAESVVGKGKQSVKLSAGMFGNGSKLKKVLAKDLAGNHLAGGTVGHVVTHEMAHGINNKSAAITAKAYAYTKKHFDQVGGISNYAATNVDEAFAEMFAKVMNTPPGELDDVSTGFLEALNEGLAKAGRPLIGGEP